MSQRFASIALPTRKPDIKDLERKYAKEAINSGCEL